MNYRSLAPLLLAGVVHLHAAEWHGQVVDAVTSNTLARARIELDAAPPDGAPEFTRTSDLFGFYAVTNLPAGVYRATLSHGGYLPAVFTNTVSAVTPTRLVTGLIPLPGGPGHELWVQVRCVTTAEKLNGVPVAALRFGSEADPSPAEVRTAVTDADGFAQFDGLTTGYYRFEANAAAHGTPRPKWDAFSTSTAPGWPDKVLVNGSRVATFMLKPNPLQALTIRVLGMNPVSQASGPLAGIPVELTGHSLHDGALLVPARHGLTDPSGLVTFGMLPAIEWRAKAQRLGYTSPVLTRRPAVATGNYAAGPHDLTLSLNATVLEVELGAPYAASMLTGLPVMLQGLTGTFTEGISRTVTSTTVGGRPVAVFTGLSPGRYSFSLDGGKASPPFPGFEFDPMSFAVHYRGRGYGEAVDGRITRVMLSAVPVPARVKLRLFVAEESGELERTLSGSSTVRPLYQLAEQAGITFREAMYTGGLIMPAANTAVVDTGPDGAVSFSILPGLYGIKIPVMTNHWGSNITYWETGSASPIAAGWPFGDPWPHPSKDLAHHSGAVPFFSGTEVSLDLYVRRKAVTIEGVVKADPDDPAREQILAQPATAGEVSIFRPDFAVGTNTLVTLSKAGSPPRTTPLTVNNTARVCLYRFKEVTPGIHTFSVAAHPRHTFGGSSLVIGAWAPYPGATPPVPPTAPGNFYPLTVIEGSTGSGHPAGFDAITATAVHGGKVTLDVYSYDPGPGSYVFQFETDNPQVVQPAAYATNAFFSPPAPHFRVPDGGFGFWRSFSTNGWFRAPSSTGGVYSVYLDGPLKNVSTNFAPDIRYKLTVRDVALDDPTLALASAVNTYPGGVTLAHGVTTNDFTGPLSPSSIADPKWAWPGSKPVRIQVLDADTPHLQVTALLNRGLSVTGRVVNADTLAGAGAANLTLFDRYGAALLRTVSLTNGNFSFSAALPAAQTMFLEAEAPGYQPWRSRHGDTALLAAGTTLSLTAPLKPLPPPVITNMVFNRRGLFLPGVAKTGDQSLFTGLTATPALTATWTATVQRALYADARPRFDHADGTARPLVTNQVADAVAEVILVDPRSFPLGMYNPMVITNPPPASTAPLATQRKWLRESELGLRPQQFVRVVGRTTALDATNVFATAGFLVSDLPAGPFQPVVAAVSQNGQIGWMHNIPYADPGDRLNGVFLPKWLATSLDMMSTVAGVQATAAQVAEYFPAERFGMLPTFTGAIAVTNQFLHYDYEVGVEWSEGMTTPSGGELSLGPGVLGLTFNGAVRFGVHGVDAQSVLQAAAEVETDELTSEKLLPPAAKEHLDKSGIDISIKMRAAGASTSSVNFNPASAPFEHEVTHSVGGGYVSVLTANLTPVLARIPYVGPLLKAADESGALTISGILTGGVGLRTGWSWRTPFPPNLDSGTGDPTPHVLRRHFLGGAKETAKDLALCFRFGVGAGAESEWIRSGITAELLLEGTNCVVQGNNQVELLPAPSVETTFNTDFDWPLIKRVRGQVTVEVNAHADLYLKRIERQYRWELAAFDHQFNTEAVFSLAPLDIQETVVTPSAVAGQFDGQGPQLVSAFSPSGVFAASGSLAVYANPLPGGGTELIPTWHLGGGVWTNAPGIAVSGAVVDADLAAVPGGGWILAWSELAAGAVGAAYPGSTLRYATSNASGSVWSAPATVDTLPASVAREVRLAVTAGLTSLISVESADGPRSDLGVIQGRVLAGPAWSAPLTLAARAPVHALAAAAGGSPARALVAWRDGGGTLRALVWSGLPPAPASAVRRLDTAGGLALAVDDTGKFRLAWQDRNAALRLDGYQDGAGWSAVPGVFTNLHPSAMALLASPSVASTVLAWSEGGAGSSLHWMALDASGGVVQAARPITANAQGRYTDLALSRDAAGQTWLLARYLNGTNAHLRVFALSIGSADPDLDGDGMADALELQIADADPADGLHGPADVLPDDDFDGDGHTNREEVSLGLDPTDPRSALRIEARRASPCCGVDVVLDTLNGRAMTLDAATNLLSPAWQNLSAFTGDGFPAYFNVNSTNRTVILRSSAVP